MIISFFLVHFFFFCINILIVRVQQRVDRFFSFYTIVGGYKVCGPRRGPFVLHPVLGLNLKINK